MSTDNVVAPHCQFRASLRGAWRMVFLFDSSGTENAEAGSGMGVELLVDFGVGDVGKVLG